MTSQFFSGKSAASLAIPLVLALLAAAAPVRGQNEGEAEESDRTAEEPELTEVEVIGDRVARPLPEPDLEKSMSRIYLSDMQPWNWNAMWHASEWANGDSRTPWKYGRIRQALGGNTHFILNASGAPELKAQKGHPAWRNAMYEVDVTIPQMRPGLIASPIWLYDDASQESIALQVVGKKHIQLTVHAEEEGVRSSDEYRIAGDYSGKRMKLAIRRHADLGLIDFFADGELIHRFTEASAAFPNEPMRPVISLYPADKHGWAKQWAGSWQPLERGEQIRMTVHGYRVTPL